MPSPVFLVDVKEAKLTDVFQPRNGRTIYEQDFLPHSLVKVDQGQTISFVSLSVAGGKSEPTIYPAATNLASPLDALMTGAFTHMLELTSLKSFVAVFAGHVAAEAARG